MSEVVYSYIAPEGKINCHTWTAVGQKGGIHIWAEPTPVGMSFRSEQYYGGIEKHSKAPMYSFNADKPDHSECWLLKCPCWHDGSSLYFSERIEPLLRDVETPFPDHIHEYMNRIMHDWYSSHFLVEDAADA